MKENLICFIETLVESFATEPPNLDLLFVLPQKVSKKVKTAPASLEKLALSWLKPSKLAPLSLKQDSFLRQLHLFFGLPDEVTRRQTVCNSISLILSLKISTKCTTGDFILCVLHY